MKTIINNPNNLNKNKLDNITFKVRALILDDCNNIIITKYADIYMLPGGKMDKNEEPEEALIRELKEELGIQFSSKDITPFVEIDNYIKDYPIVNSNNHINKLNKTIYFIIKTNKKINTDKINLTDREKENNFCIEYLSLDKVITKISNYKSINARNKYFKDELINVLNEFLNTCSKSLASLYEELEKKSDKRLLDSLDNFYINNIIKPYKESEKVIDLHTHTNYSDGELTPNELIRCAIKKNIGVLAITDHDTIEGIKQVNKNDSLIIDSGIKIINGIELSAKTDHGRMHILGLGIDLDNPKLNYKLNKLKDININYVLSIIEQIKKDYNIVFTYEELKQLINSKHNLGRPDIAKLLVKNEYAKTKQESFDKYLIDADSKLGTRKKGLDYSECIDLILGSNGIPILAHPNTLNLNDKELLYLLKDMINCGLMGIEVYHSSHSKEETDKYLELANELGLLISGGSDFHGIKTKPDVKIGTGINNNLKIKSLSILDKIKR